MDLPFVNVLCAHDEVPALLMCYHHRERDVTNLQTTAVLALSQRN